MPDGASPHVTDMHHAPKRHLCDPILREPLFQCGTTLIIALDNLFPEVTIGEHGIPKPPEIVYGFLFRAKEPCNEAPVTFFA